MRSPATTTKFAGIFSRRLALPAFMTVTMLASCPVTAQNSEEQAGAEQTSEEPVDIETLLVIGQRGQARSALDSPVPVDVFTASDLKAIGAMGNELGEALAGIASSSWITNLAL